MKKILIVTQKVDKNDPILGFFHRWLEEFAKYFEKVTVICLEKGKCDLPQNVKVLSLGKENGRSKFKYLKNFYHFIWQERENYEVVFVHMNEEYVLLAGLPWRLLGKRISMWRNHPAGSFLTSIAVFLCDKVFCTSKYSYTARFKKTKIMPVGIDLGTFKRLGNVEKRPKSLLFLARISPIKKPDVFIEALKLLSERGEKFSASMYGDPPPENLEYYMTLKEKIKTYGLTDRVSSHRGVPNNQTVSVYNEHEIFVNLSPSGMYDKTIFEAAACGALPLTSNKNLIGKISEKLIFEEGSIEDLVAKLKTLLNFSANELQNLQNEVLNYTITEHSLKALGSALAKELSFRKTLIAIVMDKFFGIPIIKRYKRVIIYLVAGGTAAFVDLVLLFIFTSIFHIWYLISAILAFIVAFFVSFILSKFWTFADRSKTDRVGAQATIYFVITATNLGLNTLLMYLFVDYVHLHYMIAQFITSGLLACESYVAYHVFVFKKSDHE